MQEVVSPEDVRVSWWLTRKEMESQGIVDLPPPVSSDAFTNLIKCQIKEVIEDFSTVSQITVFHVLDLAFVFHANILETQYLNCAGMVRVFFTCNRFKDSIFFTIKFPASFSLFKRLCGELFLLLHVEFQCYFSSLSSQPH